MLAVNILQTINVLNSYNLFMKEALLLYAHFTDTEVKAQRREFTCPKTQLEKGLTPSTVCKGKQRFLVCNMGPGTLGPNNH